MLNVEEYSQKIVVVIGNFIYLVEKNSFMVSYRYQHIRNCQGSQTTVTNKYSKKGSKIKTVNKPVPIPPTRLTNGIQSVPQIAHGFDNSNLKISNWLSGIPTNSSKEKFLADISKVILTHLPFSSASRIINSFGNLLGDSRSNDGSFNINDPPSYSVNDVSNYEQNEVPVINLRDSNSNTPISQIKSELQENDNIPDINALQVLQNIITS